MVRGSFVRIVPLLAYLAVFLPLSAGAQGGGVPEDTTDLLSIREGIPGVVPFWNIHSRRFIHVPAFEMPESSNVERYLYIIRSVGDSSERRFTAESPWKSLAPVWRKLAVGEHDLRVVGIRARDTVQIGNRHFIKSPRFAGVIREAPYGWRESAKRALADLFAGERVQCWLRRGRPNDNYPKWIYPSKMMAGVAAGMLEYARLEPSPAIRKEARRAAVVAADFLLSLREPRGAPCEYWPPTFWRGVDRDIHPVVDGEIMSAEPAEVGMILLDLHAGTGLKRFRDAAIAIARTYVKLQLPQGTWYQRVDTKTGGARERPLLIPVSAVMLFDRLIVGEKMTEFQLPRQRAFSWILDHPMETYNWEAQFEDTRPKDRYRNQSHLEAVRFASLLLKGSREGSRERASALELLRWAEDSFVVWDRSDPILSAQLFKPNARWNGNDPYFGSDWFVPAATEQFAFFTPINSATAVFVDAYCTAYRVTGDRLHLAKARALASTLTIAQRYWGGGEIPTHLRRVMPELNWLNAGVYSAIVLRRNAKTLDEF